MQETNKNEELNFPIKRKGLWLFIINHPITVILLALLSLIILIASISFRYAQKNTMLRADTVALMGLSRRHYQEGKYDEAIKINKELEDRKSNNWFSEMSTGNAYFKKGDYKTAERYFIRAVQLGKTMPMPHHNLALCYYRQGKIDQARKTYQYLIDHFGDAYPNLKKKAVQALSLIPPAPPNEDTQP